MKTTNKVFVAFATILVLLSTIITVDAIYSNWQWKGQGQWQGMSWNRDWGGQQLNKQNHTPWDLISQIATWTLSEQEKLDLAYQYSEEKVAKDLYNYFYSLYGVQTFQNIANSEAEHMDAVKVLLDRYNLSVPTTYWELQDEYEALKFEWEKWLKEALEVWLKIEMLDINDIVDTIKTTDNDDLKIIFTNIWWASYNHMRWFLKWLLNNNFTTSIDYSNYLVWDEVESKWSLKYKLAEKLESEWIVLPDFATSTYIKENCVNEEQWLWNWQWKNHKNSNFQRSDKFNQNKNLYKSQIWTKYGNTIKNLNQNKLNTLDWKLDKYIESIENDKTMTESQKEKYLSLYYALREYLDELK